MPRIQWLCDSRCEYLRLLKGFLLRRNHDNKCMDDAIECMKMAVRRKNKNVVVEATKGDFEKIIKLGAKLMQTQSCFLWGLNPSSNDYFLKRSVSRKNGLVLGSCFGILNRWDTGLLASISERGHHEDVERTLRHIERDGRVPVDDVCSSPSRSL